MVISNRPVSCQELQSRFPQFFVESAGDIARTFHAVASAENAPSGTAIFISNPKVFAQGIASEAAVVVVPRKLFAQAAEQIQNRTVLAATNVELAMASVINEFFLKTPYTNAAVQNIHPTAVVSGDAELHPTVRVGPHAFIGSKVKLGPGVYIGASSVIEDQTEIGEDSVIHPLVFIGHSTEIGRKCEVHPQTVIAKEGYGYAHDERGNHYRIPHQGKVVLEDDVHIGASCSIDRGTFGETRIEMGTKLDNQIHIAHNCRVGRNSILTAGFMMAGSSRLGANFVAGGGTVVTGHIDVCDNVQVAGLSGVQKSIREPGQYGGHPIVSLQQSIKIRAALTHLPELRRQVNQLSKRLEPNSESEDGPIQEA